MADVVVGGRYVPLPPALVRRAVRLVLTGERRRALVSVTFLGPRRIRALNLRYLEHDRPTDVLAFALPGVWPGHDAVGDLYICRSEAEREARALGIPLREELLRLVVHGTLHLLGYEHPAGPGRTRSRMWRRQERYLRALA